MFNKLCCLVNPICDDGPCIDCMRELARKYMALVDGDFVAAKNLTDLV